VNDVGHIPWWYELERLACSSPTTAGRAFVTVEHRWTDGLVIAVHRPDRGVGDCAAVPGLWIACSLVSTPSEFGDDGAEGSVLREQLSFAGLEFADSLVGLVELVVECDESGSCRRHGNTSSPLVGVVF
jgi:hypothetical protein